MGLPGRENKEEEKSVGKKSRSERKRRGHQEPATQQEVKKNIQKLRKGKDRRQKVVRIINSNYLIIYSQINK